MEASGVDGIMIARGALIKVRRRLEIDLNYTLTFKRLSFVALDLHRD